ncbi:molybdenum cofactor biosynthesis protein A [Desulfovibrio sp. X2]|uniref:GTP 3',8-cyclase MoaA n=1 Tax=Desulfovibrio sp. X2 TaxID=941449 RepID=UPI000358CE2B|nr:GTP 3',8-cyclase MoaA [Desulfovibrio sp. X2]EPR37319.1 molybdenum cofactor biosynthesis protein A [Desulfovibrio sp. X2]
MTTNAHRAADSHGREVSYLRLSVTDRCNLRCAYCWSCQNMRFLQHSDILSYEEMLECIAAARDLGISKVRLTGGEPFVRRGCLDFVAAIRGRFPDVDVRLTTNATLLEGVPARLAELGVRRINISLDTLDRATFERVTGRDFFDRVRTAIDESLAAGLRVKINAVAMRGINDHELPGFIDLARRLPLDVRFIEHMPMGGGVPWDPSRCWPADEILEEAAKLADLVPEEDANEARGPARMYRITDGAGRLGLISPLSNHFCNTCNRLRITADGRLRTCLFSDKEYSLRPLVRSRLGDRDHLARVLRRALLSKPVGVELLKARRQGAPVAERRMSAIGG